MKVIIELNKIDINDLFDLAICRKNRMDFYSDLRIVFQDMVEEMLKEQGVECSKSKSSLTSYTPKGNIFKFEQIDSLKGFDNDLDYDFCLRYGFDNYSIAGINYQNGPYDEIPSLSTFKYIKNFSIGNLLIPLVSKGLDIRISTSEHIKVVGFVNDSAATKRKPYIAFVGITFNSESLNSTFNKYLNNDDFILDEIKFKNVSYPILFICRKTGKIFTCECFKNYVNWDKDLISRIPYFPLEDKPDLKKQINSIEYLKNICHLCTGTTPNFIYGSIMYHSNFLVRYMPYYYLMNRKLDRDTFGVAKVDRNKTENELREMFGHFKIGERWFNETFLYNLIKDMFSDKEIAFHYRGKEMEGLEIDIWIPELKIGFEYQGVQHYQSVKHWGGELSLKKQQENDKRKKELSKINGYNLIEINFHENISKETIYNKLKGINFQY
jgi:hypothetical protein